MGPLGNGVHAGYLLHAIGEHKSESVTVPCWKTCVSYLMDHNVSEVQLKV